jgi:hypothetical protein
MPSTHKEVRMQQLVAWELLQQEVFLLLLERCMQVNVLRTTCRSKVDAGSVVAVANLLRSRTRTRRRRRKRAWRIPCADLLPVCLIYGTLQVCSRRS